MLNYSDEYMIDLVFQDEDHSIFRRISLFTNQEWVFLLLIDSWQPWCISPRLYLYLGRVRLQINFALNCLLPPMLIRIAFGKYFKGVTIDLSRRAWFNNLKVHFAN